MPLFLQALPLSFSTFWRFLILLPFLAVFSIAVGLLSNVPLLGMVVPGAVAAFCTLTGLRCALAARGHYTRPDFSALVKVSLMFSVLGILGSALIGGISLAVAASLRFFDNAVPEAFPFLTFAGTIGIASLLFAAYSAVLAVPMTSAAASVGRQGGDGTGFVDGFGQGFFSLMLVTFVWAIAGYLSGFLWHVQLAFLFLAELARDHLLQQRPSYELTFDPLMLAAGLAAMIWASCWFYATAVLAWENAVSQRQQAWQALAEEGRPSADTLRALREARERGERSPTL